MPQVHLVKKARKDNSVVKKGESYYWWKFNFGSKMYSKTKPRRSQLTQSGFLSQIWDIEDRLSEMTAEEDLEASCDEIVDDVRNLQDEAQEKLDNMPEQLQDSSSSGQMLQERVDELDNMISELEDLDCEEERDKEDVLEEIQNISYNGS
ncbi:hypothetical protein LCGC14_1118200 [marine sediment metagenome]|uniref:Uncharacterized protein n=1 Tax=marine sediment metagenome TaxID=412755 RepID=A0A0F9MSN9_9ZZZZ